MFYIIYNENILNSVTKCITFAATQGFQEDLFESFINLTNIAQTCSLKL